MTDKRKDEMPERVWVYKDVERVIHVAPFETGYPVQAEYIRKDLSTPVPDDVLQRDLDWFKQAHVTAHLSRRSQEAIANIIRAASTPSADKCHPNLDGKCPVDHSQCLETTVDTINIKREVLQGVREAFKSCINELEATIWADCENEMSKADIKLNSLEYVTVLASLDAVFSEGK